ncbi:nucleotide-binding domain-containing protein [Leucogyrophana mollusca]|uniref:Nucleotide-binding domain-containing protein n=1 Tax=Leucogyrophana mollusca TaxID=85980 RepID=A0ACB8BL58_9AGAM|nr:nucleotide-binding domain-containing protein [Leucogyrophana mollusca]
MAQINDEQLKEIIVIGAGVVGLTTALRIQEKGGYRVTIVAETFPTDPKSIRYTSHWAGAHHVSHATDERQRKMDQETFKVLWELSAPGRDTENLFVRHQQTEYRGDDLSSADWLEFMPDFKYLPENELIVGSRLAYSFSTITMNTPVYLNWLLARFLAQNGSIVRGSLQHIGQVIEGGASIFTDGKALRPVDAVVACVGLGARTLGGIEDKDVYPIRGQTVLLKAPWVRFGRTMTAADGTYTYTMPRSDGTMLVGGTRVPNDWYPLPRPEITEDILARALALTPELAPPHTRENHATTVNDLLPIVIEPGCGLRPGRKGGIRLEAEWFDGPKGRKVPVVFNYGHAGYGFLSSWGSASMALEILEGVLSGNGAPPAKAVAENASTIGTPGN